MNALSFSGNDFKLTVSEPNRGDGDKKSSKSEHSLSPANTLAIPDTGKPSKLSLRIHSSPTDDRFEKREKSPKSAKSEDLASPGTPLIMLTPDDDGDHPSLFIPSTEDDEQAERLNQGRNWNDIEQEAVGKEKFRQVLNELLTKRGKQLPVGEQDKGDEENIDVMIKELDKRKAQDETAPSASKPGAKNEEAGIKRRKTGSLSLDA